MDKFNFTDLTKQLIQTQEEGVTFEDKQLKWNTAEDVKDVVDALSSKDVVHFLKLEGNTLGIDAASAIGKAIERHPELRKALWRNLFTGRLKTEIPQVLKLLGNGLITAKARLVELDLSDNALGPNGMVGLEDLLRSPVCYSLQILRLNNTGLGIGGGKMLSKALLDCHRLSTEAGTPLKLKVFIAGRNRLENEGAKAIAEIFKTLQTLEEIAMPQNSIYHVGIGALAEGFKENPNLKILNLNDNTVGPKGASYLAEAFAFTPLLRDINFGDCLLKTNGAYQFGEALEQGHMALEEVDLSFNEIGSDGGIVIASAMGNKPNLKKLNLDGNQFGYEGCTRVKEAMMAAVNPNALCEFEEDQSEGEEEGDDEDEDDDDDDEEDDESIDEEDEVTDDNNDTTEEADGEEHYEDENEHEETAYTTTQAFPAKFLNDSVTSIKTAFGDATSNSSISDKNSSAELFCLSETACTLQMFDSLPDENKLEAFKSIINQFSDDERWHVLIFTTLKCAHLSQTSKEALELAVSLFKETIDKAVEIKQEKRILNYILIQLGLLRSEEKFKTPYNLDSCRFALRETLKNQNIASELMKNTFNVFLEKLEV